MQTYTRRFNQTLSLLSPPSRKCVSLFFCADSLHGVMRHIMCIPSTKKDDNDEEKKEEEDEEEEEEEKLNSFALAMCVRMA